MIGIVTVNWRGYDATLQLTRQILENTYQEFKLVITNNSPEETAKFTQDGIFSDPRIQVIHTHGNLGYSGGLNRGLEYLLPDTQIEYFLLLNNDIDLEKNFLEQMLLKGTDPCAIYSPLILLKDTELVQNTGGDIHIWLGGAINLNKDVPVSRVKKVQPDFLSGSILFMHRSVLEKVGLFDEDFGSYAEDTDFCYRAKALGMRVGILWDIQARHFHSYSTAGDNRYKIYLLNRNQIIFAKKHLSSYPRVVFITSAILRGFVQNLLRRRLPAYFKGVKEGLRWKPTPAVQH